MKVERKRAGKTLPSRIGQGELRELGFDGYTLTVHAFDGEGREMRVSFDRHEVTRLTAYASEQLQKQRKALERLKATTDVMYGGTD